MLLRVKSIHHTYLVTVPQDANLAAVKRLLPEAEWTDRQFVYQGLLLQEDSALSTLDITAGSTLLLVTHSEGLSVRFRYKNMQFAHKCAETTTIGELRRFCGSRLAYSIDYLHLYLQNELLSDELQLGSFGPQPVFDVVTISRPAGYEFEMFVKTLTGKTHYLMVNNTSTIGEVKELLADREGQAPSTMRLIFAGKQLRNEEKIEDTGAASGRPFHMVYRLR